MLTARHDDSDSSSVPTIYEADRRSLPISRTTRVLLLANDMMSGDGATQPLNGASCSVSRVGSVDKAISLTGTDSFDVIVIDFRPDLLGHQAIRQLRMAHVDLPICFVSARSTADARDRAFAVGADDVVVLPFDQAGLRQRLEALAKRAGAARCPQKMQVGRLEIDLAERHARVDGRALPLYSDEYAAFELLVSRNGAPVGKSAILLHAYEADGASPGSAGTLISRLRRKLAKAGAGDLIQSFGGLGYGLLMAGQGTGAAL